MVDIMSVDIMSRGLIESQEKWRDWAGKIPAIRFDSDWDVRVIPPFAGALARFWVGKGDKSVSVYFDGFSALGFMMDDTGEPIPYYEIYDGCDTERFYMNETDEMMNRIRDILNDEK